MNFDPSSRAKDVGSDYPKLLRAHLMYLCEDGFLEWNSVKLKCCGNKFASARAIRAAWSFYFSTNNPLASVPWHFNVSQNIWVGNPALDETVKKYYKALKRTKVSCNLQHITDDE